MSTKSGQVHHDRCIDVGEPVTGTNEGSGTSATGTRRTVSLAGASDRSAGAGAGVHRVRKDGAVGVDGVTKEQYGRKLQENLENLHKRLKAKQYRHQPIRRVHIPKDNGKTRPIGISAFEDRVVQDAIREVLQAIYEQDFLECSHGFRPGRSAHDAIRALDRVVHRGEVNWVLEADIVSYFDSLDRTELKKLIQIRVADGSLLRLIGKCLHVGVLDGADYTEPETRAPSRGRGFRRCSGTSICTTCSTYGSNERSSRACQAKQR